MNTTPGREVVSGGCPNDLCGLRESEAKKKKTFCWNSDFSYILILSIVLRLSVSAELKLSLRLKKSKRDDC